MVDETFKIHLLSLKVKLIYKTIEQKDRKLEYTRENLISVDTKSR